MEKNKPSILIIDDEVDTCQLLERYLTKRGFRVVTAYNAKEGLNQFRQDEFNLILTDFRLPDQTGLDILKEINAKSPGPPVIVITGYSDIRTAVNVIKYGAFNYITKPIIPEELLSMIQEALAISEDPNSEEQQGPGASQSTSPKSTLESKRFIVGESQASKKIHQDILLVAPTPMSVLITGETGTGKEYAAREIHANSKRRNEKFVAIDCGALPDEVAASELFGHKKGAFTGANSDRTGKFMYANGGTLFLDEIGNLSYDIQVKLLRVLEERKISRLGDDTEQEVDLRIIAATNEDLQLAIDEGDFREDLLYRINEFGIKLLPLRDRPEDLKLFIDQFIAQTNKLLSKSVNGISDQALDKLMQYHWPGNLRELKNVIKRAVLKTTGKRLEVESLPVEIIYTNSGNFEDEGSLKSTAKMAERDQILQVLAQTGNNKSKAARLLNIDRKTLYNKLKSFNIS